MIHNKILDPSRKTCVSCGFRLDKAARTDGWWQEVRVEEEPKKGQCMLCSQFDGDDNLRTIILYLVNLLLHWKATYR